MLIAFAILALFLFFGQYLLSALQISGPALSIAGGVVLFLIALRMVFPPVRDVSTRPEDTEPFIVPLAMPLIAGPSAMATVILLARQHPGQLGIWFLALLAAWFASFVVLLSAEFLRNRLGSRFITAVERLMGMILTALSVQMLLSGIESYVRSLAA
jgi:multiple antibiotic resistance protein